MEPHIKPRLQPVTELSLGSPLIPPVNLPMDPSPDTLMDTSPDTFVFSLVDPSPDSLAEALNDPFMEPFLEPLMDLDIEPPVESPTVFFMNPSLDTPAEPHINPVMEPYSDPHMERLMEPAIEPPMAPLMGPLPDPAIEPPMAPLIGPLMDPHMDTSSDSTSDFSLGSPLVSPMGSRPNSPRVSNMDYLMESESPTESPSIYLPDTMGLFFRLPPELRIMIWVYLFSTIHTRLPNGRKPNTNPLSILRTSRYLYNEISSHLYDNCTENIFMKPAYDEDEWMRIRLESTNMRVDLIFKDKAAADKHFQNFPHHQSKVIIHLEPPKQDDPGQLVLLWKKSVAMVDLIINTIAPHPVSLFSKGWQSSEPPFHWQYAREDFFKMGGLQETIQSPYSYFPDHDIVTLPFISPRLWFEDPAEMATLTDCEFFNHRVDIRRLFYPKGLEHRMEGLFAFTKETAAAAIERALLETDIFLENSLDELPGRTASFLRRDRFKDWFEDGQSWESAYQVAYSEKLSTCPWVVMHTDPWLINSNMRYITLILIHHQMYCLKRGYGVEEEFGVFTEWNSCMWSDMFRLGLPELSVLRHASSRRWTAEQQFRIFNDYAEWIAGLRAENHGFTESQGYLLRRLNLWNYRDLYCLTSGLILFNLRQRWG
jgi:hypothetical protein